MVRAIRDTAREMGTSLPGLLFVVRVEVGDLAEYVVNRPAYVRERVPVEEVLRLSWSKDNIIDLFAIGDLRTFKAVIRANRDLYKKELSEEELEALFRATAAAMWVRATPPDREKAREEEEVLRLLEALREPLRSYARAEVAFHLAEYRARVGDYEGAKKLVDEALKSLEELSKPGPRWEELASNPDVARFFSPLGGKPREKLAGRLRLLEGELTSTLGHICLDVDKLDEAVEAFRRSWRALVEHGAPPVNTLAAHSWYVRASILGDGPSARPKDLEGRELSWPEHLRAIWRTMEEHEEEMTPKATFARYVGALMADAWEEPKRVLRTDALRELRERMKTWPNKDLVGITLGTLALLLKLRGLLTAKPGEELGKYALEVLRPLRTELGARRLANAPISSALELSSILLGLLEDRLDEAAEEAEEAAAAKGYSLLLRRLFRELAEAIRAYEERGEEAREALIEAVLKLFYLHL